MLGYQPNKVSNPNTNFINPNSYTPVVKKKRKVVDQQYHSKHTKSYRNNIKKTKLSKKNIQSPNSVFRPPPKVITNHDHNQHLTKSPSPITENTPPLAIAENHFLRAQNNELKNQLERSRNIAGRNLQQEIENTTDIEHVLETKTIINSNRIQETLKAQIKSISKNQVFKKVKFISSKAELTNCQSKSSVGAYFLKCFTNMYPMDTIKNKHIFWADIQDTVHQAICEKRGAVYNRFKKRWFGKFPILILQMIINIIYLTLQRAS